MRSRIHHFAMRRRGTVAAALILVLALAGTAIAGAGRGADLELGVVNTINSYLTTLKGSFTGPMLQVTNTGTGRGIGITVAAGKAPIYVNSNAGKAVNLNADKLDGLDQAVFLRGNVLTVQHSVSLSTGSSQITWFSTPIVQPAGHVLLSNVAGTVTATLPATCSGGGTGEVEVRIDGRAAAFGNVSGTGGTTVSSRLYSANFPVNYAAPTASEGRNVEVLIRDYCSVAFENVVFQSLKLNFVLAG